MRRNSSFEFDMMEEVSGVNVRTSDSKTTRMPVHCGKKLSLSAPAGASRDPPTPYTSVVSASKGMLAWVGGSSSNVSQVVPEQEVLDVGCSSQEAAGFIVKYCEDRSQLGVLTHSPQLLMDVLELAYAIGSDALFFEGCLLLGDLLKQLTRTPLLAVVEGCRSSSELFLIFSEVVRSVRSRFRLPRSSRNEDALLEAEIVAGRSGLTVSAVDPDGVDGQVDIEQFGDNLKYIASFQPNLWQPNQECMECPDCGVPLRTYFGMQKVGAVSHCRVCGKGKCPRCVSYRVHKSLATVERPPNEPGDTSTFRKVCGNCFKVVSRNRRFVFLSNAFMLSGLGVIEVSILRFVCDVWRGAAELCLREYHNMLYVSQTYANQPRAMRKLVTSSALFFRGHPQAVIFLAKATDWMRQSNEKTVAVAVIEDTARALLDPTHSSCIGTIPHLHMFCTRACPLMAPELCGYQILEALGGASVEDVSVSNCRQLATDLVLCGRSGDSITALMIPLLVDSVYSVGVSSQESLDCLIAIASRGVRWSLKVYLEARSRRTEGDRADRLLSLEKKVLDGCVNADLLRCTGDFLSLLDHVETSGDASRIASSFLELAALRNLTADSVNPLMIPQYLNSVFKLRPFLYPFDPNLTIVGVRLGDTTVKKLSNSRPTIYSLVDSLGGIRKILYKKECVRKDAVVSMITDMLHETICDRHLLWGPERDAEIILPNYGVIPISPSSGLIELVDGHTLQRIYDDGHSRASSAPSPGADADVSMRPKVPRDEYSDVFKPGQASAPRQGPTETRFVPSEGPLLSKLKSLQPKDGSSTSSSSFQRRVGRRFLASAKIFLVLNYLLAIGDRHRDNVVLTPDGYILHIDFGYILGSRPLPEKQLLGSKSYVRFDGDLDSCVRHYQRILHSLDGVHPLTEQDAIDGFLGQTADLFVALRPQTYAILLALQHLLNTNAVSGTSSDVLAERLRNITMGGSSQGEAKREFIRRIRQSIGAESLRDWVYTTAKSIKALLF